MLQELAADFWLYLTSCVQTLDEHETDPALSISKPFPWFPHLRELAADFQKLPLLKRLLILKSRQMLLSWLLAGYATWRTLFHNGNRVLYLTIKEADAFKVKARVDHILANLPDLVRVLLDQRTIDNTGEIEFRGGSSMIFLPSSQNPGRSMTATDAILDEHAFHPFDAKMYAAIKPTVSGGGNIISNSTPNGVGNLFHGLASAAKKGPGAAGWNGFHYREVHWQSHPDRDEAWFLETTMDLTPRMVAQEYLLDFTQSGAVVFDAKFLELRTKPMVDVADLPVERIELPNGTAKYRLRGKMPKAVAEAVRLAYKAKIESPFYIGGDVGEGLSGEDPSAATVIEARTGRQVATIGGSWRPDIFAGKVAELATIFPGIIGIEKNGPGGMALLELERLGFSGRLYRHREWDERGRKKTRLGWVTSTKSKPIMVDELEVAIRKRDLLLSDQTTLDEARVMTYNEGAGHSGAPAGYHDDHVMALAVAWQMRKSAGQVISSIG